MRSQKHISDPVVLSGIFRLALRFIDLVSSDMKELPHLYKVFGILGFSTLLYLQTRLSRVLVK